MGIVISLLIFFIIIYIIPSKQKNQSIIPLFPAFNFAFVMIEAYFGIAFNIYILKKFRINYIYILEVNPANRLNTVQFLKGGLFMFSVWLICLFFHKLTISFEFFGKIYSVFPLIILCFIFIFIFLPFRCLYINFRKGLINVLFKNFFPLGKNGVKFADFLFGDILTSLNKAFVNFILAVCLLTCEECKKHNTRDKKFTSCDRNSIACLIVSFYPFFIRFTQCINRYYYTREAWPHLGNTLKYVGGLSNAICAWYYGYSGKTKLSLILHLIAGFVSQCYMFFWDIYMDWNLGRTFKTNFFLRDKIVYPKYMYYFAIISDFILRFFWLLNLVDTSSWLNEEWKNFIFAALEAYRRIQWCVFRIENENTNNPEKYRAVLDIPDLPVN